MQNVRSSTCGRVIGFCNWENYIGLNNTHVCKLNYTIKSQLQSYVISTCPPTRTRGSSELVSTYYQTIHALFQKRYINMYGFYRPENYQFQRVIKMAKEMDDTNKKEIQRKKEREFKQHLVEARDQKMAELLRKGFKQRDAMSKVGKMTVDEIMANSQDIWYAVYRVDGKNNNKQYLMDIFQQSDSAERYAKIYTKRHDSGRTTGQSFYVKPVTWQDVEDFNLFYRPVTTPENFFTGNSSVVTEKTKDTLLPHLHYPRFNWTQNEESLTVRIKLPGLTTDKINIKVEPFTIVGTIHYTGAQPITFLQGWFPAPVKRSAEFRTTWYKILANGELVIDIVKRFKEMWPFLFQTPLRLGYLPEIVKESTYSVLPDGNRVGITEGQAEMDIPEVTSEIYEDIKSAQSELDMVGEEMDIYKTVIKDENKEKLPSFLNKSILEIKELKGKVELLKMMKLQKLQLQSYMKDFVVSKSFRAHIKTRAAMFESINLDRDEEIHQLQKQAEEEMEPVYEALREITQPEKGLYYINSCMLLFFFPFLYFEFLLISDSVTLNERYEISELFFDMAVKEEMGVDKESGESDASKYGNPAKSISYYAVAWQFGHPRAAIRMSDLYIYGSKSPTFTKNPTKGYNILKVEALRNSNYSAMAEVKKIVIFSLDLRYLVIHIVFFNMHIYSWRKFQLLELN